MEIWPEWEEVEVPVYILHLGGIRKENLEPLFKSFSIAESYSVFSPSLNLISVVRLILPSPVKVSTLTLDEVPWEYMFGGRAFRADLETKLS